MKDIDKEFEEFVKNNYDLLTKNQKEICRKLGIFDEEAGFLVNSS